MKHSTLNKLLAASAFAALVSVSPSAFADGGDQPVDDNTPVHHEGNVDVDAAPSEDVQHEETPAPDYADPVHVEEPVSPAPEPTPAPSHDSSSTDSTSAPVNQDVNVIIHDNDTESKSESDVSHEAETDVAATSSTVEHKRYGADMWKFKRLGVGVGGSFIGNRDGQLDAGNNQAFKLDFNFGPVQAFYYSKRSVGAAFLPAFPVYKDRVSFLAGAGMMYNIDNDINRANVELVIPAAVDVRLFHGVSLRAGPTFFMPTNIGDVDGVNGDIRRESLKHPRADVSVRFGF